MKAIRCSQRRSPQGFTLVEIAIVLVIVSLLLAAGIGISVAVVDNVRAKTTRQNLESVKLSLQAFIARNGRLPCPAVETLGPANTAYGIEDPRTTNPATSCTNTVNLPGGTGIDAAKRGVVPWKTLGMTLENASDGWNNQLTYMVTVTATVKSFDTVSGMRGSLYLHSATPPSAGLPATGNQINACSTTANDNTCNKAAVVILISHGRNIFGGYTSAGVRAPMPTDAGEVENTNDDRFVVSAEPSSTFDDIVAPLTPDDFLASLAAQGAIRSERALLSERARQVLAQLAAVTTGDRACIGTCPTDSYRYRLPAPTGIAETPNPTLDASKFPIASACTAITQVQDLPAAAQVIKDPWGNPFKYQVAVPTGAFPTGPSPAPYIDRDTTCPTPIVLVSMGPNNTVGLTESDDWFYYTNIGEWKEILGKVGW